MRCTTRIGLSGRIRYATAMATTPPTTALSVFDTTRSGPCATDPNSKAVPPACAMTAPPPRTATAAEMANATTTPVSAGPAPMARVIKCATTAPTITPPMTSSARLIRLPMAPAIVPTATAGANNGSGLSSTSRVMNQDSSAAKPACAATMRYVRSRSCTSRPVRRTLSREVLRSRLNTFTSASPSPPHDIVLCQRDVECSRSPNLLHHRRHSGPSRRGTDATAAAARHDAWLRLPAVRPGVSIPYARVHAASGRIRRTRSAA